MNGKILVPSALPNNLHKIRAINKGYTLSKAASELLIDKNFLSFVENWKSSFSGKTTIRAFKFFDANFYKMYDVKEEITCPVSEYCAEHESLNLSFSIDEIKKKLNIKDASNDNLVGMLINNGKIISNQITKKIASERADEDIKYNGYSILNSVVEHGMINLEVSAALDIKTTWDETFDINFARDEDVETANLLYDRKFNESITSVEKDIDNELIKIVDGKIIMDKEYKIPLSEKDLDKYNLKREFGFDEVQVKYNTAGLPSSVKFRAIRPEMTNLLYISTLLNIPPEEIYEALGMTYNGYINLIFANQKISSKGMWRLVKKLRLPLEVILNIDEYFDRFCIQAKKIEKKRSPKLIDNDNNSEENDD